MFGFKRKSTVKDPSEAVRRALVQDGLPMDSNSTLAIVTSRGNYAGRGVTYFRVFDRVSGDQQAVKVAALTDLDTHRDLIVRSGHIEKDGTVVINWRAPATDAATPVREASDDTKHASYARYVRPNADQSAGQ